MLIVQTLEDFTVSLFLTFFPHRECTESSGNNLFLK
jgi:hypothetical protein